MSFTEEIRLKAAVLISSQFTLLFASCTSASMMLVIPKMAFKGVRSSWLMLERK